MSSPSESRISRIWGHVTGSVMRSGIWFDAARLAWTQPPVHSNADPSIDYFKAEETSVRYSVQPSAAAPSARSSAVQTLFVYMPDPPFVIETCLRGGLVPSLRQLEGVTTVIAELPGFGFSRPRTSAFRFSLDEMTRVFSEFVLLLQQRFKPDRIVLGFPCVSGLIALKLAHEFPSLVQGLVLIQTGTFANERTWADTVARGLPFRVPVIGQIFNWWAGKSISDKWVDAAAYNKGNSYHAAMLQSIMD